MNFYNYIKETHTLRQKPTMEEPIRPIFANADTIVWRQYDMDMFAYNQHLGTLTEYPCAPGTVWEEGKEYVEGKDFEVYGCNCKIGQDCPFIPGKWLTDCEIAHPLIKEKKESSPASSSFADEFIISDDSQSIIEFAKKRFKELEHKDWDWRSFYNGCLEVWAQYCFQIKKLNSNNYQKVIDETPQEEKDPISEAMDWLEQQQRTFTLEDMQECWEAAWKQATDGWVSPSKQQTEQYFKSKGIDLP